MFPVNLGRPILKESVKSFRDFLFSSVRSDLVTDFIDLSDRDACGVQYCWSVG